MPIVKMPDGKSVRFPDDMPREQIKSLIASKFPTEPTVQQKQFGAEGERSLGQSLIRGTDFIVRKGIEGVAAPVGIVGDAINAGINTVAGTNLQPVSQVISQGLTDIGYPEPETANERVAGDVISGVTGAGGVVRVGQSIGKAAPELAKFLSGGARSQLAASGFGSGAASIAREEGATPLEQALVGFGAGLSAGALTRTKQAVRTADEIRKQSRGLYKAAEEQGGTLNPQFSKNFAKELQKIKPSSKIGQRLGKDSDLNKVLDKVATETAGESISLEAANDIDKFFTAELSKPNFVNSVGKLTEEGQKLYNAQASFRNLIEAADDTLVSGGKEGFAALKQARKLWSQSRKLADVEAIIERAATTDNPASAIKSGFRALAFNPKRLKAYNAAEIKAIKKAAESGIVTDALRTAGSRLIPIITGAGGGGLGATAASAAASTASRGAASASQVQRAQAVSDAILGNQRSNVPSGLVGALLSTQNTSRGE